MNADFCVEVLKEALAKYGTPEIFNTDQGSQFTSGVWIDVFDRCNGQDQHGRETPLDRQPDD